MAEAVGLVTGLASLAISIAEGAARLRDLYKESKTISQEVESLLEDLKFLTFLVKGLEGLSTLDDHDVSLAISHCRKTVQKVASTLEEMTETLDAAEKKPRKTLSRMRWLSTKKKDLKKLQDLTIVAKLDILSMFNYPHHMRIPALSPTPKTYQRIGTKEEQEQPGRSHIEQVPPRPITAFSNTLVAGPGRPRQRRTDCTRRACSCTCHIKGQITSRFWNFEYTPLSFILKGCSNPDCTASEYVSELHIALTQLGWHRAITFGLRLTSAAGTYSIRPSLQVKEEVVRYTSRGFELLWRLREGFSDWQEVVQEFREMYQEDKRIIRHVNPAGRGYIGELLWYTPYFGWAPALEVLEVFMAEFEMETGLDDINFLYRMARWIGEGPHLWLFEELLALGFNPCNLPAPSAQMWPEPCDPNWLSEEVTPDPFFLELLAMMVSVDPDFGGTTPLQREILCGSAHSVSELLARAVRHDEINFLGQTALHLAVFNIECAPALISAGYAVDATDRNGTTPLMYACAMGNIDMAKLLISEGASLKIIDKLRHWDFLGYTLARGHYKLASDLAFFIQGIYPDNVKFIGGSFAKRMALSMCYRPGCIPKNFEFEDLFKLDARLDFTFPDGNENTDGNNIMHYWLGLSNAKTLIAHGFTGLDQKNSDGITPLMKCTRPWFLDTMDTLIEHGADVNSSDLYGRTPMHYAVREWPPSRPYSMDDTQIFGFRCTEKLLRAGARPHSHDLCRCACSPKGCTPAKVLGAYFCHPNTFFSFRRLEDTIEWLCLLEENGDAEVMKAQLISFIRCAQFDEMELTHTCCDGGTENWASQTLSSEDKETAVWEESEGIAQLESQISLLEMKSYKELRDAWLHQLRRSHDHYLKRNNFQQWEEILRRATVHKGRPQIKKRETYTIDSKKDCFEPPSTFIAEERHDDDPIRQMVALLWALEKHIVIRRNAKANPTELERGYNRRLSWVIGILDCMNISRDLITMRLRERGIHSREKNDGPFAETVIEHFLQSCKLFHSIVGNSHTE